MRASLTIFFLAGLLAGLLSLAACESTLVVGYVATNVLGDDADSEPESSSSSPSSFDPGYEGRDPDPEPDPDPDPDPPPTFLQDGTAAHPWEVDSITELQSIATGFQNEELDEPLSQKESLAAHYVLTADIDAYSTAAWNDEGTDTNIDEGFLPIGHSDEFKGNFDGAGYIINGLNIDRQSTVNVGLFGSTGPGAVLRNITVENSAVQGLSGVGKLVGHNRGLIRNCHANGLSAANTGTIYVGGLVGYNSGTIQDSHADNDVRGRSSLGGLVGYNTGPIEGSYATGSVISDAESGDFYIGGLVGSSTGTVRDSYATGNVHGDRWVGGLVGNNYFGTVQNTFATGDVSGRDRVGGLVGYNTGTVKYPSALQNSYATGTVSGGASTGGLVGQSRGIVVQRGYCVDSIIKGLLGGDDGDDCMGYGPNTDVSLVTVDALRALTCEGDTASVFGWDHDGDDPDGDGLLDDPDIDGDDDASTNPPDAATPPQDCATAGAANFPWDFGTSEELPVLNGTVGGLDPAGQRALIDPAE